MAGDPVLMKVKVDGIIGPATVKAVNYAIKLAGGFPPYFKTPNMNVTNIRQYAGGLATVITQHIQQRGGTVPPAEIVRRTVRTTRAAPIPIEPSTGSDSVLPLATKYVFWGVGIFAALLALSVMAKVAREEPPPRKRKVAAA